ncbi:HK97 family phage prohead protease [Bradyrhizobium barranii]|uniref:HK97 family phage prohead protease n=1 Tax=Bradyrhizobium TaxID=374 RepID=UPI003F273BA0
MGLCGCVRREICETCIRQAPRAKSRCCRALGARSKQATGRVSKGTLSLRSDNIGLYYSLTPTSNAPLGQEALATIGNGTVTEVSVSFTPIVEEWDDSGAVPRRLITEARLYEISLVIWRAYGDASSAHISRATVWQPNVALKRRCVPAPRFARLSHSKVEAKLPKHCCRKRAPL